ncbi:MAG: cytochrome P450 [Acidimicrobiales bacterium]|nr:cytochrome P450 [Acidimicrobiales bacterium]
MSESRPVQDWKTDFDVLNSQYIADPFSIWDELRGSCPIAHTERRGSTWLPTTYEDVTKIAHDIERFSSAEISVIPFEGAVPEDPVLLYGVPPISADPPLHTWTRRLLLPWFSHKNVDAYEEMTRELCKSLVSTFIQNGRADAAADYAQQIPVRVIAHILGVPSEMSDTFTEWVRDVLEFADDPERRMKGIEGLIIFFIEELEKRQSNPGADLLSVLLQSEVEGEVIDARIALGTAALVLIAGVDTTWSAIGSSLWHLATHPDDRKRMVEDKEVWPLAIEELLRAYSPVTMARVVTEDTDYEGCPMKKGDKVLMNFPAANRDPKVFENPDEVILDRAKNRHVAFGSGIHRCAGSNLARMELRVALEEWLSAIPDFSIEEGKEVTWAGGQVRGPRQLPVIFK